MEQRNQALRADVVGGRFLSDLRALRTQAGLDHGQLAARAHFPRDVIAAAEAGPRLPALPVLAAYVRGCGGTGDEILAWEDRWRTVTGSKAHPLLSARVAGLSGANRPLPPENSDSTAIRSALQRFGNRMSQPGPSSVSSPSSPAPEPTAPPSRAAAAAPAPPAASAPTAAPAPEAHREGSPQQPSRVKPTVPNPVAAAASDAPAASTAPVAPATPAASEPESRKGRIITIAAIVAVIVILLILAVVL